MPRLLFTLSVLTVTVSANFALSPLQAEARVRHSATFCAAIPELFQGEWEANSDDLALSNAKSVKEAISITSDDQKTISYCAPGKYRDTARAYNDALAAAILHSQNAEWKTVMNLSIQLLQKCVVSFYAEKTGAQCQTDLETNIQRKIKWSSAE